MQPALNCWGRQERGKTCLQQSPLHSCPRVLRPCLQITEPAGRLPSLTWPGCLRLSLAVLAEGCGHTTPVQGRPAPTICPTDLLRAHNRSRASSQKAERNFSSALPTLGWGNSPQHGGGEKRGFDSASHFTAEFATEFVEQLFSPTPRFVSHLLLKDGSGAAHG